jgi:hypothetical protein
VEDALDAEDLAGIGRRSGHGQRREVEEKAGEVAADERPEGESHGGGGVFRTE